MNKVAKETILEKIKSLDASKAVSPTSTGVLAGIGGGLSLATLGSLLQNEDPSKRSLLTNPLLLGALGTAGGYLAGNTIETLPTKRTYGIGTDTAISGVGLYTLGKEIHKKNIRRKVNEARLAYDKAQLTYALSGELPGTEAAFRFEKAKSKFGKATLNLGTEGARSAAIAIDPSIESLKGKKILSKVYEHLKHSRRSPFNAFKALIPTDKHYLSTLNQVLGIGKNLKLTGGIKAKPYRRGRLGAALMLAGLGTGAGKYIYNKVTD